MAYFTFAKRTSLDYRFTIDSLDDPALAALRQMVKNLNVDIATRNKRVKNGELTSKWNPNPKLRATYRVLIRPRGPRLTDNRHTLMKNATHYDVYIGTRSPY